MMQTCYLSLSLNGDEQILRIPQDLKLSGMEVMLRKEGDRLIVEVIPPRSLLAVLKELEPIDEAFPEVDSGLLLLDEVEL